MANVAQTKERWDDVLAACRERPGDWAYAAALAGLDSRTVKRMWFKGWPRWSWGKVPIQQLLFQEASEAKRLAAELAAAKKQIPPPAPPGSPEEERQLAVKVRMQEAQLLTQARGNVIALMAVINPCLRAGLKLAPAIQRTLEEAAEKGNIEPRVGLAMFHRMGAIMKQAAESAQRVMEMERLRLGLPQATFGVVGADQMSAEQAVESMKYAASVAARAEALGLPQLALLPGGAEATGGPGAPLQVVPAQG